MQPARSRLAEVVAAISLATDLGMGQPLQHALRTCVIATRLAEEADVPVRDRPVVYYTALLRYLGCTADAHMMSAVVGDEIAARAAFATTDPASTRDQLRWLARHATGALTFAGAVTESPREVYATACEVGRRLAARLGLADDVQQALLQAFERWDGKGFPAGLAGDRIGVGSRIVAIARDAEVFQRAGGARAAVDVVAARAGAAYDPELARVFCESAPALLAEPDSAWDAALAAEPAPRRELAELDDICRAIADFADLKTPWTIGHSTGVAELAEAAGWRLGLDREAVTTLRRAALVHDLGRVGVPNSIWERPGPLDAGERERVRLHPYLTERVLAHAPALAPLAAIAGLHHERLDGSGYHRGCHAASLPTTARVLAAADVYHALTEPRPHRPARTPEHAADTIKREVAAGPARRRRRRGGPARGRAARARRPPAAGGTDRARDRGAAPARAREHQPVDRARALDRGEDRRPSRRAHLREDRLSTRAAASLFASEHDLL